MKWNAHKRNDCNICRSYVKPAGRPRNVNPKGRKKPATSGNYFTSLFSSQKNNEF